MATGYVQPSGIITLYSGVPLSPTHTDVIYITSNQQARNFLDANYAKVNYTQESYQRQERGYLKIGVKADDILTYNYLSWTNGRMYFFAFVTNVGYVNENCTEIQYIIDNYMTWFPFVQLGQCFVEREIPESDELFANLVPENLEIGNLKAQERETYDLNGTSEHPMYYVIQASTDLHGEPAGGYVNGLPCSLHYVKLPTTASLETLELLINYYHGENPEGDTTPNSNTPENIINIQLMPSFLADDLAIPSDSSSRGQVSFDTIDITRPTSIDGYEPKNNKLYSYPYSRLAVSNNSGQINEYKWELLGGGEDYAIFDIIGTALGQPAILCYPEWYQGKRADYDSALMMTNFPPVPWINDTYKAYLAQNKASIATSIVSSVLSGLTGGAVGINSAIGNQAMNNNIPNSNPVGQVSTEMGRNAGILSAVTAPLNAGLSIAQTLVKLGEAKFMPNSVPTLSQADMIMLVSNRYQFDFYKVTITQQMAKVIDDYFSAFGYAIHRIKRPNISSRKYWNYTKTNGCILNGTIPAQAKTEIIGMFDSGVRLWQNPTDIGNFSLPNSIN